MLVVGLLKKNTNRDEVYQYSHLEMFLSGSSLSGFSPRFVLSLSSPHSCCSSAWRAWCRRIEQVCAASLLRETEELG